MSRGIAVWATLAAIAAGLAALAHGLPADTFVVGDPGVKLIAASNAIATPATPLQIPLPTIDGEPLSYVDPFFARHDGHTHAVTSELFPLVSAPFVAAFGIRGAYVLPALGFLLAIGACAWLAIALDSRRTALLVMLTALLETPFLFYGLEFWEHAPAVGVAAAAVALFVSGRYAFAAGLLFGLSALFRPEALWFAIAVIVAARWLPAPPSLRATGLALAGIASAFAPLVAYTLLHFGTIVTPHVAGNPAIWGDGWIARRLAIVPSWFLTAGSTSFWRVGPAALIAFVPLGPRFARGGRRFLWAAAIVATALVALTAPNDGGSQWGPRYLLPVYIPLTILAADALEATIARRRILGIALVVLVFGCGAWVQRASYKMLRDSKLTYGRVLQVVEATVPRGGYVVSDLWWLDQVAASAAVDRRVFLYAADDAEGASVLERLSDHDAVSVTIVRSRNESSSIDPWPLPACYREGSRTRIPERELVFIQLRRNCA